MTLNYQPGPLSSNSYCYHSDGNGNVTMLINGYQAVVAKYLYDAFGNTISAAGSLAQANLYRFSSKEWHVNSGLAYYLYRYYDPNLQRWPNRDPLGDYSCLVYVVSDGWNELRTLHKEILSVARYEALTGETLYEFLRNKPNLEFDPLGLCPCKQSKCDDAREDLFLAILALTAAGFTLDPAAIVAAAAAEAVMVKREEAACAGCGPPGGTGIIPGLPPTMPPPGPRPAIM